MIWSLPNGDDSENLIVTNNVLLAGQNGNTVAINLDSHQVIWSVPAVGPIALSDNELFIGSGSSVMAYTVAGIPEPASFLTMSVVAATYGLRRRRPIH